MVKAPDAILSVPHEQVDLSDEHKRIRIGCRRCLEVFPIQTEGILFTALTQKLTSLGPDGIFSLFGFNRSNERHLFHHQVMEGRLMLRVFSATHGSVRAGEIEMCK